MIFVILFSLLTTIVSLWARPRRSAKRSSSCLTSEWDFESVADRSLVCHSVMYTNQKYVGCGEVSGGERLLIAAGTTKTSMCSERRDIIAVWCLF